MRKFIQYITIALICVIAPVTAFADITAINVKDIPGYKSLTPQFEYLFKNLGYYQFWSAKWAFNVPKDEVKGNLTKLYSGLQKIQAEEKPNLELELMMGEVAQFLFNLDENEYFEKAMLHYAKAESVNKEDYRSHWFAARTLTLAAYPKESILKYNTVVTLTEDPLKLHPHFWDEYAYSAATAHMPSTALMCLDLSKKITGKDSPYEPVGGSILRNSIVSVPVGKKIDDKKQWTRIPEENIFINRLFGFRVHTLPGWTITPQKSDTKILSSFILSAPAEKGKSGNVACRFSFIAKQPGANDTLQSSIDSILAPYKNNTINSIEMQSPYENAVAYEVIIPSVNKKEGGGHYVLYAVERDEPNFPGVRIEFPEPPRRSPKGEIIFQPQQQVFARYKGKIHYFLLMDTADSVFDKSKEKLEMLLSGLIVIE